MVCSSGPSLVDANSWLPWLPAKITVHKPWRQLEYPARVQDTVLECAPCRGERRYWPSLANHRIDGKYRYCRNEHCGAKSNVDMAVILGGDTVPTAFEITRPHHPHRAKNTRVKPVIPPLLRKVSHSRDVGGDSNACWKISWRERFPWFPSHLPPGTSVRHRYRRRCVLALECIQLVHYE